jgi:hypothetical protein
MKLKVIDALCAPGTTTNEDRWGFNPEAVWVMDGATGVWPRQRLSEPSDAAWFVAQVDDVLTQTHFGDRPASDILAGAAAETARRAGALCDIDSLTPLDLPSAGFACARMRSDGLELVSLGDCPILLHPAAGPVRPFGTSALAEIDGRLVDALGAAQAKGLSFEAARASVVDLLREQRAGMNRPGGYWILDLSGAGAGHAQTVSIDARAGDRILLMSDGFYRLVDVFGRFDPDQLFDAAVSQGLRALYHELRDLETQDEDCRDHVRFKPRDDATAVLLQVE